MFSSPWFFLLLSSSTNFLSPQLSSWDLTCTTGCCCVTSHLTPASSRRLQPCVLWPREGHSPRNSSFPVHLTWSRCMGPFPWPKPFAASAPPLKRNTCVGEIMNFCATYLLFDLIFLPCTWTLTCVQVVDTLRLHSGRSSPSHKYSPSHHGDRPRLDPPSCCCHPQDALGDLTDRQILIDTHVWRWVICLLTE